MWNLCHIQCKYKGSLIELKTQNSELFIAQFELQVVPAFKEILYVYTRRDNKKYISVSVYYKLAIITKNSVVPQQNGFSYALLQNAAITISIL